MDELHHGSRELSLGPYIRATYIKEHRKLRDAAVAARDHDEATVLTEGGREIAAIVPVEVFEFYQRAMRGELSIPGRAVPGGT